jgi:thiamine biosynthesis lipoprotein
VSAGGDLRSTDADTTVSIVDHNDDVVTRVHLGVGALATSCTRRRSWLVNGEEVSHLIHPSTMTPVRSPIVSASVIAETAVEAEAGAKAVILRGADGLAWADAQDWIHAAIVIWHDGSVFATTGVEMVA